MMSSLTKSLVLLALLSAHAGLTACRRAPAPGAAYQVDTVRFTLAEPPSSSEGPAPGVWIDTNASVSGLYGGTLTTRKPYGLGLDYTDERREFAAAELSSVQVIYDDGTVDPGAAALELPLRIASRDYETVNSVGGGRVVRSRVRIISTKVPGVISRDEPFRLRIEGRFTKEDGSTSPFTIDQRYEIETERGTKRWEDVMKDA